MEETKYLHPHYSHCFEELSQYCRALGNTVSSAHTNLPSLDYVAVSGMSRESKEERFAAENRPKKNKISFLSNGKQTPTKTETISSAKASHPLAKKESRGSKKNVLSLSHDRDAYKDAVQQYTLDPTDAHSKLAPYSKEYRLNA